jgi:hypothetical protein
MLTLKAKPKCHLMTARIKGMKMWEILNCKSNLDYKYIVILMQKIYKMSKMLVIWHLLCAFYAGNIQKG